MDKEEEMTTLLEKLKDNKELQEIQMKIAKHYEEINKLRKESEEILIKEVEKIDLYGTKIIQDFKKIFNMEPSHLSNYREVVFNIENYNMQIKFDMLSKTIIIGYEPNLNFDGGVDPDGDEVRLELSKVTLKDVLDSMKEMLNKRLDRLVDEEEKIGENITNIYDLVEIWKKEEYDRKVNDILNKGISMLEGDKK